MTNLPRNAEAAESYVLSAQAPLAITAIANQPQPHEAYPGEQIFYLFISNANPLASSRTREYQERPLQIVSWPRWWHRAVYLYVTRPGHPDPSS